MLRFVAALSLIFVSIGSCGGESVRAGDGDDSARPQTGGASTGGVTTNGGTTTGTGGTSGAGGFGPCADGAELPSVGCIETCYEDVNFVAAPECRNNTWQCPSGLVWREGCPPDACANREYNVCCGKLGDKTPEPCDTQGWRQPCPANTERIEPAALCLPEGIEAAHCLDLEGLPCSGPDVHCNEGTGCATNGCECRMNPDAGGYAWSCWVVLC